MAEADFIFSVRGIVRGYQLFPDQGPLKEFFLDDSEGLETPIRLTGVNLPMRDGHDVEVFFVREKGSSGDVPLLACNYSIHKVEEVRESTKTEQGGFIPGCGLSAGWIIAAVFLIGIGFGPALLIGGLIWYFYRKVPVDKKVRLSLRHREHRKMLEAYIRRKYGGMISFSGRRT